MERAFPDGFLWGTAISSFQAEMGAGSLRRRLAAMLVPEQEFEVLYEFLAPTLLRACRAFGGESAMLCETFSPEARARLERHGLLTHAPQRGRWPEEWAVSPKARELLKDLPGGRCLEAV